MNISIAQISTSFDQADIFRNGVALLAFVMAFYALVARERKTPYVVRSVYAVIILVLFALLLSLIASAFPTYSTIQPVPLQTANQPTSLFNNIRSWLQITSAAILAFGLCYILLRVVRERNRHLFFRDDQLALNNPIGKLCRSVKNKIRGRQKRYEHNPTPLSPRLTESLLASNYLPKDQLSAAFEHYKRSEEQLSISAVFEVNELIAVDDLLADLSARFLQTRCYVQYTTCTRHPIEFLFQLKSKWKSLGTDEDWAIVSQRVVVVDAFTPHFGFTDSIHNERSIQAKDECRSVVTAKPSFAGVHTAIANAFNEIKSAERAADEKRPRTPTLVIYEGCSALADLESNEQYRIFVRHVIPSERLFGGMFTLFVEHSLSDDNRSVLRSVTDIFADLKARSTR